MSVTCPCGQGIPIADINVSEGVALCRSCGKLSRLMDLATPVEEAAAAEAAHAEPPTGCRIEDRGSEVTLVASARSVASAGGLLFFALFWNGIVSVFVVIVASSLWLNLIGPLPAWFPTPTSSGNSGGGSNGAIMPLGMALFMCLFLTPFIIIGLAVACACLVSIAGRVEVRLRGPEGLVYTGIGPIGWRRRFDASKVKAVRFVDSSYEKNGKPDRLIAIEGERTTVKFGSVLSEPRRLWMGGALKTVLMPSAGARSRR